MGRLSFDYARGETSMGGGGTGIGGNDVVSPNRPGFGFRYTVNDSPVSIFKSLSGHCQFPYRSFLSI